MALEPLVLDTLTWSGMTAAIRQRIAPASASQWTLHAPVDPGVTLLELYAWLLEQRLFWLDQTPDSMVRGALALLGVSPRAPRPAGTVLQLAATSKGPATAVAPANTDFALASPGSTLTFTTFRDTTLLPVDAVRTSSGGRDVTADLEASREVELFTNAAARDLTVEFPLAAAPAAGGYTAVLLRLITPGSIAPQWEQLGRYAKDASTASWQYTNASGGWSAFGGPALHDGTAGFRRSGVVRFAIPADWAAPFAIRATVADNRFVAPPRLAAVLPNVDIARQRRTARYEDRFEWLPLPGNQIDLSNLPPKSIFKDVPVLDRSICLELRERDGQWRRWRRADDFMGAGPADRVFTFDAASGTIVFGNGIAGRIPRLSTSAGNNVRAVYHAGGGLAGNVAQGRDWESRQRDSQGAPLWTATNPVAASAGAEEEPLEQARSRAASFVREGNRAVLKDDFETLARTTPGIAIARAHAAVGYHPCYPCERVPGAVTVFVVPEAPRPETDEEDVEFTFVAAPVPDPGQLAAISSRLESRRLLGSEVYVRGPIYRPVSVVLEIVAAAARFEELKTRLGGALRRALDPLGGTVAGLADAYPFGEPVRPSALRRVAQQALGRDGEVLSVRAGLDGHPADEACRDLAIGPHDLPYLASFDLAIRPPRTRQGGLR